MISIPRTLAFSTGVAIVRIADQPWELHDVSVDRAEIHDVEAARPETALRLVGEWEEWARSVGVIPWNERRELVKRLGG